MEGNKMSEVRSNDFLVNEKVGRLMRKFAVPCIISLLLAALYNIVDQIFIANAKYLQRRAAHLRPVAGGDPADV